jgi:predicted porin
MQKKLIALAVAGLSSAAAFAQSNVTVYGIADVYYGRATADGMETQTAINSGGLSSSRIGFKGMEDLGNGLKAVFTLEYALSIDSNTGVGTGSSTARQQYVGLAGNFGTVVAGRLQTAGYDWSGVTNALHATAINPLASVQAGLTGGSLLTSSSRADSAVAYISPEFGGGFKVAYNHARLTESANANANLKDSYANLVSGTYSNGPLAASLVYAKKTLDATVASDDVKEWGLGGSYDFGVVKLFGSYQRITNDGAVGGSQTDKAWQLSGVVPVSTAGAVVVGYAKSKRDVSDTNTKSWTLAYTHGLSKRTTLYTGYQRVSNDSGAILGNAILAPATAGGDANLFVGGVRHSF